jgi:enoyl-CoA hydratase/carnithine racemase
VTDGAPPVRVERRGAVLVLTLNRPDRLNAVSLPMYRAIVEALDAVEDDTDLRAAVLTGAGRAFCVGADLNAHAAGAGEADRREYVEAAQEANARIQRGTRPVIAAVNGHAIGGGLELALSCDLMVVAAGARLRFPELALGTFVGGGVTETLPARVGPARARELLYLAEFFSGEDAAAMGLANRAVAEGEVLDVALEWGDRVARLAPRSVRHAKRLLRGTSPGAETLAAEAEALLEIMGTEDWREGIAAFHEKREPRYTGD